jgi:outer membrane lipoprotein LolB
MDILKKGILFITLCCLLAACEKGPSIVPPTQQKITWEDRQQQLSTITAWQTQGALGVQDGHEAQSASFDWQQVGFKNYKLRLIGPVGTGLGTITGTPSQVVYRTPKNKLYTAPDSKTLLAQQTGWILPIDNLYYWMRGLPVPSDPYSKTLDDYNRIINLQQDGWQILFMRYTSSKGVDLPSKIFMSNANLKIRIVISSWNAS